MSVGHQLIPIIFTKQPSKFELAIQKWFHKKSHDTYFPQLKETSCDVMYGFFILPKIQNQPFIGILQNSCFWKLDKIIWKTLCEMCPNTGFFLVCIFPHSDWVRRDTKYLSVFSPNAGKYRPEKTLYLDTFHAVKPIRKCYRVSYHFCNCMSKQPKPESNQVRKMS